MTDAGVNGGSPIASVLIVGVGKATVRDIRHGYDGTAFMVATRAIPTLGMKFRNRGRIGDRYIRPFGVSPSPPTRRLPIARAFATTSPWRCAECRATPMSLPA